MTDVYRESVELHRKNQGKLGVVPTVAVKDRQDLSLVYTPGVAQVSREIAQDEKESFALTWRGRTVAVVSDGSAVLGLGNIGAAAAMPVMEGKALLFKQFGKVEAVPICVDLHTADELVTFVRAIAPSFGGINLEDITSPLCIEVEDRLQDLGIPVMHDDQHGTAMVVLAGVMNAARVVGKNFADLNVTISGAGSAGLSIAQMLLSLDRQNGELIPVEGQRVRSVTLVDSKGIIVAGREGVTGWKEKWAQQTNPAHLSGGLAEAMRGADVLIGVSQPKLVTAQMVAAMAEKPIVLAMANPEPEILPEEAKRGGAAVVGTGRSDYDNQVNNSLIFPGFFRGLLSSSATRVTVGVRQAAAAALAGAVTPTAEKILPSMFDPGQADRIAEAVAAEVEREGLGRGS